VTLHGEPLGRLLAKAETLSWDSTMYVVGAAPWGLDSLACTYLDPDGDEPDEVVLSTGDIAKRVLQTDQVQQIVENLREQVSPASEENLVEALNFYYARDAFIDWLKRGG